MPTTVNFNSTNYPIPLSGEINWGSLSALLIDVGTNAQTKTIQKATIRVATSSPVTVLATSDYAIVTKLSVAGAVAVNLPAGVAGQIFSVVDGTGDAATNNITITPASGTINGSATYVIDGNRNGVVLAYSGTEWVILSEFIASSAGFIPRAQIATGTADQVVINSGTGALSSEAQLAKTRGGTGITSTATFPASGIVVTETATETLTNKTLTSPTINSATMVTPALGTPSSGVMTNVTGLPLTTGVTGTLPVANGGTGTTTSTGTGNTVLSNSPTLVTPALGTPSAVVLTSATGLPLTTGVTGTLPVANGGTGVTTSTGTGNTVLSTSPTLVSPNLDTPTSLTLTNATGLPLTTGVTGVLPAANGGTGQNSTATFPTSGIVVTEAATETLTNKTLTSPTMTAPVLGTPASGTMTNVTGLPLTTGVTGVLPTANGGTGQNSTATFPTSGVVVTEAASETLTNKTLTTPTLGTPVLSSYGDFTEIATPATPSSGILRVYSKSGDALYIKNSAGTESQLSTTAVATPTTTGTVTSFFPTIQSAVSATTNTSPTITTADGFLLYSITTTTSGNVLTLPGASTNKARMIVVAKTDTATGNVIITAAGSDTIDGATTFTLNNQYSSTVLISDGVATWRVIERPRAAAFNATTSVSVTSDRLIYNFNTPNAANYALNLPAASTSGGQLVIATKTVSSTGIVTVTPAGADTIEGAANYTFTGQYEAVAFVSDGVSSWSVVSGVYASATRPGLISLAAQTYAGVKAFTSGIKVKDTGAGSTTLSWYEEGAWTPGVTMGGTQGTAAVSVINGAATANFTRIGRTVHFQAFLRFTKGTGTGAVTITGLPYTSMNNFFAFPLLVDAGITLPANTSQPLGYSANNTHIDFEFPSTTGASATALQASNCSTNWDFIITGTYTL